MASIRALLAIPVAVLAIAWAGIAGAAEYPAHVNVNTADAETIAGVLKGVGMKKAKAIVRYRETHGRFNDASELTKVRGIGRATVARNAGKIIISGGNNSQRSSSKSASRGIEKPRRRGG